MMPSPAEPDPQSRRADELRRTLLDLTYRCPLGEPLAKCPFKYLSGLSHPTRQRVFESLDEKQLLGLFDLLPNCNCPADPRSAAEKPTR